MKFRLLVVAMALLNCQVVFGADENAMNPDDSAINEQALYDLSLEVKNSSKEQAKSNSKKTPSEEAIDKYMDEEDGHQLYREDVSSNKKDGFESSLRKVGITDTARAFGSQAALHWRYNEINKIVEKYSGRLDAINFRPFVTDGMILTPSVLISKDDENFITAKKMVKTNISFVVDKEATIVSVPPTYRDYLLREFSEPLPVNPLLRPKNEAEKLIWRKALAEGWELGVEEAFEIFSDGLLQMEKDIQGRINYRKLVQLGMISPAALKVTKSGVTFNDRTMNVGETIYEIEQEAQYNTMDEWRSAWLKAEKTN